MINCFKCGKQTNEFTIWQDSGYNTGMIGKQTEICYSCFNNMIKENKEKADYTNEPLLKLEEYANNMKKGNICVAWTSHNLADVLLLITEYLKRRGNSQ